MGLFEGKKGLVLGIANNFSIAWAITQHLHEQGAEMGFTHLPDGDRPKNEKKVRKLVEPLGAKFVVPCDVCDDSHIEAVMDKAAEELGQIDFLLHSIAFAPPADLTGPTYACSRKGFSLAMEISAYSLLAVANAAQGIMNDPGSILTLTYFGGERIVPGYNVMGVCKAALEASVRYAAYDLGPKGIRVNALSAGPLKTLAASAVDSKGMEQVYEHIAPLGRNITHTEVGRTGAFLLSDMSNGMTAEIMHVDAGYNSMGSPGRMLDLLP